MLSVALCTYNGANYIRDQLESIINQSMRVDEIVICDDGSTDNTIPIIETIRDESPIEIHIKKNGSNLGFKNNFIQAIQLCKGSIVFLSDQDDIWYPNKVRIIYSWFKNHPKHHVVFTNATLIDSSGHDLNEQLWHSIGFDKTKQQYFNRGFGLDIWAWSNRATGATMAFRKEFVNKIVWDETNDEYHDKIIALHGITDQVIGCINISLIYYRLHDGQSCGINNSRKELYFSPLKPCPSAFLDFDVQCLPEKVRRHVEFLNFRSSLKKQRSIFSALQNYSHYFRIYGSWAFRYIFYDLIISIRYRIRKIFS